MKIVRNRYVVMRNNRTEIWCGCAKNFEVVPVVETIETALPITVKWEE